MTESSAYGGPTFAGSVVRVCALRRTGVIDVMLLALSDSPSSFFEAIIGNGSIGAPKMLERVPFPGQDKRAPATLYARRAHADARFSVVAPQPVSRRPQHLGSLENRQRELDVLAYGYGADPQADPWFDARQVNSVVALQLRTIAHGAREESVVLVPIPGDAEAAGSVELVLQERATRGELVEAWGYSHNILPVPGDGTVLSWTEHPDFHSVDEYVLAYSNDVAPPSVT